MKKLLLTSLAFLCFIVIGCGDDKDSSPKPNSSGVQNSSSSILKPSESTSKFSSSVESINETLDKINALLSKDVPSEVNDNINLTTHIEKYNVYVSWTSNNKSVLTSEGAYIKPIDDTEVTLTASYTYKGIENTKKFTTLVKGYSEQEKVDAANGSIERPLIDESHLSLNLLTNNDYGATIEWSVSENDFVSILDNFLTIDEDVLLEGTSFTLTVRVYINDEAREKHFTYELLPSDELRAQNILSKLIKPELVNNNHLTVPTTGQYDSTIEWVANDVDVIIEGNNVTLPAKYEQWTLVLTGKLTVGSVEKTFSYNYQVEIDDEAYANYVIELIENLPLIGDTTIEHKNQIDLANAKYNNLTPAQLAIFNQNAEAEYYIQKLNDINAKFFITPNIEVNNYKITWPANDKAIGYEVKFIDLNKVYQTENNEFDLKEIGIPLDSMYNISVKALAPADGDYIESSEGLAKVGTLSELPILPTPEISWSGSRGFMVTNVNNARSAGAKALRVYANGILRREFPINDVSYYSYSYNGIAESAEVEQNMDFAIQFIGDYITCQSSNFTISNQPVIGAGFALDTKTPQLKDGYLTFYPADWNAGYEIRINDFKVYYTEYNSRLNAALESKFLLSELGLEDGTHKIRIRAMADDAGTPAALGDAVTLTVTNQKTSGPTNISYDNHTNIISWDESENVLEYQISIPKINYVATTKMNKLDLSLLNLQNDTYAVEIKATLFSNDTSELESEDGSISTEIDYSIAYVDYTKTSTYEFEIKISLTKLDIPTNIAGHYTKISWDAVENAIAYEVYFVELDKAFEVTNNEFVFSEHELRMNFDYTVKVRALAENVEDNSLYSEEHNTKYDLVNVASTSNGTVSACNIEAQGGQIADRMLDGSDSTRWESAHGYDDVVVTITLREVTTLYKLYIYWEAANAALYNIEISDNGETWNKVFEYSTDNPIQMERKDYIDLYEPTQVKYIRINCIARAIPYGYSIFTFEAYTLKNN